MKQCVSCLKYYFTLSLPFEQRLVFRLRCDVQNVVSIILKSVRNIDLSWDFFFIYISCHKWAVYDDRANTRLRAPVVRRLVPNELPLHTRHGALMLSQVYFGALRHCNTQINIRGRGNAHKCFKICDEYCSYRLLANHLITNWNWRQGRRLAMTSI